MINELKNTFSALADRNRLRILALLKNKPFCVCELQAVLKLAQSTISEHLQVLKDAALVQDKNNSFWTDYAVSPKTEFGRQFLKIVAAFLKKDPTIAGDLKKSRQIDRKNLCRILRKNK